MGDKDFAKDNDFQHHLNDDWHIVHGLWVQIRGYLDRNLLRLNWKTTPQSLTLTNDSAWHELDLTAYTSSKTVAVIISIGQLSSGGRWFTLRTRKKGSSADYEGIFSYNIDNHTIENFGGQILQAVDGGQVLEYNLARECNPGVYLVGYWDTAA